MKPLIVLLKVVLGLYQLVTFVLTFVVFTFFVNFLSVAVCTSKYVIFTTSFLVAVSFAFIFFFLVLDSLTFGFERNAVILISSVYSLPPAFTALTVTFPVFFVSALPSASTFNIPGLLELYVYSLISITLAESESIFTLLTIANTAFSPRYRPLLLIKA